MLHHDALVSASGSPRAAGRLPIGLGLEPARQRDRDSQAGNSALTGSTKATGFGGVVQRDIMQEMDVAKCEQVRHDSTGKNKTTTVFWETQVQTLTTGSIQRPSQALPGGPRAGACDVWPS